MPICRNGPKGAAQMGTVPFFLPPNLGAIALPIISIPFSAKAQPICHGHNAPFHHIP